MAFNPFTIIKSLLIKEEGVLTPKQIEIVPGGTANTKTTLVGSQTTNKTITLPDATDTLATLTQVNTVQTNLDNHINDPTDAHDASAISNIPAGTISAIDVQSAINELDTDIQNHINETTGAHAASAISNTPSGNLIATDVQGALNEIQTELDGVVIIANNAATKELDNLTTTALNTDLLPDADGTRDLGSSTLEFAETHSKSLNRTTAGNLTISVASGNLTLSPSGDIDANNNLITNVANPTAGSHAANKEYVDSLAAGFDPKAAVRVASTTDIGGSYATTPSNGRFTGAATSIDGVSLTIGDRVLLKDQIDLKQNGIYEYTASGEFTRAADSDGSPASEVSSGNFTFATQGTLGSASGFVLLGNGILTLNVDDLNWTQSSGGASGASRFLDNLLSPVAINQNLLPGTTNTIDLGSTSLSYKDIYSDGKVITNVVEAKNSALTMQSPGSTMGSTNGVSVQSGSSTVANSGGLSVRSGNAALGTSGNVSIETGTATTRGDITMTARSTQIVTGPLNIAQGNSAVPLSNQQSLTISSSGVTEGLPLLTASDSTNRRILVTGLEGLPQSPNLIMNGDAEGKLTSSTSIFTPYADLAGTSPVDGIGGSPNVTSTVTATTPLAGFKSYLLTKDAANRQGQGWSILDVAVPLSMRGRVLSIKFDYMVNSGTFVAGTGTTDSDVTIWIYDIGNLQVIQPSSYKLLSNSTTVVDQFQAEFQTPLNMSAFRLIAHIGSTSAAAYTLELDNIVVSPSEYVFGTPISDPISYTPTFTGFGTVTNINVRQHREGKYLVVEGTATLGTSTATPGKISFPSGQFLDTTSISTANSVVGEFVSNIDTGTTLVNQLIAAPGTATDGVFLTRRLGANNDTPLTLQNANAIIGSGAVSFKFKVPIAGQSSSVQMADQTSTRVVAAAYSTAAGQNINNAIINFGTQIYDTHAATTTGVGVWRYTAPASGYYRLSVTLQANVNVAISVFKNGSVYTNLSDTGANSTQSSNVELFLNAGEFIDVRGGGNANLTANANQNHIEISRISGPSQIASSETVAAKVTGNAATATAGNVLIIPTVEYDTHNAYNATTGRFTAPTSGIYKIYGALKVSTGGVQMNIYKNAVISSFLGLSDNVSGGLPIAGSIYANAGDILDIRPNVSATMNLSTSSITYERIGNRG